MVEKFPGKRTCPIEGCRLQFLWVPNFREHLTYQHSIDDEDIEEYVKGKPEEHADRQKTAIKCILCGYTTLRTSHMKKHMMAKHRGSQIDQLASTPTAPVAHPQSEISGNEPLESN